jgi:hypothetical protein
MRVKRMVKKEFQAVFDRMWTRVDLTLARPAWMENTPVTLCLASGSNVHPLRTEVQGRIFEDVVGGIDVLRYDPADQTYGFYLNKDHYVVVLDLASDDYLLVHGPFKDHEHWLKGIPERFKGVEILVYDEPGKRRARRRKHR